MPVPQIVHAGCVNGNRASAHEHIGDVAEATMIIFNAALLTLGWSQMFSASCGRFAQRHFDRKLLLFLVCFTLVVAVCPLSGIMF